MRTQRRDKIMGGSCSLTAVFTIGGSMPSKPKRKRGKGLQRVTLAVGAAGMAILAAPLAYAGPWDDPSLNAAEQDYVNHHHNDICMALQADRSAPGVNRALALIESEGGFNHHDAADVIHVSVAKTCAQYMPTLTAIGGA
jgi:hypothetical protein